MIVPSETESRIIETIRSLKPYEKISIEADKQGKYENFVISRSTKVLLVLNEIRPLRTGSLE